MFEYFDILFYILSHHWLIFNNCRIVIVAHISQWNVFDFNPNKYMAHTPSISYANGNEIWNWRDETKQIFRCLNENRLQCIYSMQILSAFNNDLDEQKSVEHISVCRLHQSISTFALFCISLPKLWDNFNILMWITSFDSHTDQRHQNFHFDLETHDKFHGTLLNAINFRYVGCFLPWLKLSLLCVLRIRVQLHPNKNAFGLDWETEKWRKRASDK